MKYTYLNGYPVYHLNESCYYVIDGFEIRKYENGQEINNWRGISKNFEKPVFEWSKAFWKDLMAAPSYEMRADQWSSDYVSYLDGKIISWSDDRHENCYILGAAHGIERILSDEYTSEAVKRWVRGIINK
jgi:hypothetical protein